MTYTDVVKKLIGHTYPVGSASIDPQRFENLKEMCELVNNLVIEIDNVAREIERHEHSVKEMAEYASNFLTKKLGITNE